MSFSELQHDVVEKGLCVRCGVCVGICPGGELLRQAVEDRAISLHTLPIERMLKRILKMARGKRFHNSARLQRLQAQGKPVPFYHCKLPNTSATIRRSEFFYSCWSSLRGPKSAS